MSKKDITVDGVNWNLSEIQKHKTEAAFLKEMESKTYAHIYEGESRTATLKELYALAHPKAEKPKEVAPKGAAGKANP